MQLAKPSALVLIACTFASQAQPGQPATDARRVTVETLPGAIEVLV